MFMDKWLVETRPNLRKGPMPAVTLRGFATPEDEHSHPRRGLTNEMERKEMVHKVSTAVSKVCSPHTGPHTTASAR
jgi:hypothetical protein